MNFDKFISRTSKNRYTDVTRQLAEAGDHCPEVFSFTSGLPNNETFPIEEISIVYKNGIEKKIIGEELMTTLQYNFTQGFPPLIEKWRDFQKKWHSPIYDGWDVQITTGSLEGLSKVFDIFVEEGSPVMLQSPLYSGIIRTVLPMKPDIISISMDGDGILVTEMIDVCEARLKKGQALPKLLYVNPTGANPVGTVFSTERRKEIYKLAQKYDFFIVEDDAYYFIHYLDEQPISFFSLDVDGRVLRLDSFSKILSAGIRLGVVTASKPLIRKIEQHMQCSTMHASVLSQMLVYKLLQIWNDDGLEHFTNLQRFYCTRRDIMLKALEKHFTGIAEWSKPKGGMFIWLKITLLHDVQDLIMNKCVPEGIFALPGNAFYVDLMKPSQFIRLSYSLASLEEIDMGLNKMAKLVRKAAEQNLTNCSVHDSQK